MSDHALTYGAPATQDDRTWGLVAHLSCFVGGLFGPLVMLLVFNEKSAFVKYHAVQALIVQIATGVALGLYLVFVQVVSVLTCGVGLVLLLPVPLVMVIPAYGAYQAWQGEWKGYPLVEGVGR